LREGAGGLFIRHKNNEVTNKSKKRIRRKNVPRGGEVYQMQDSRKGFARDKKEAEFRTALRKKKHLGIKERRSTLEKKKKKNQ